MTSPALQCLPRPAAARIAVRVTGGAERSIRAGHPWLFDGSIVGRNRAGAPGDLAVVFDRKGRFLGVGLYDPTSPIRVRILQHSEPATIDGPFFRTRIAAAADLRSDLAACATGADRTDGYRLIHGENDRLPGLVVDRYAATLVLRLDTPAWIPHLPDLLPALLQVQPAERIILRMKRALASARQHLHGLTDGMTLHGETPTGPLLFHEHGLLFESDPVHGQKTGFFLDQRENRRRVGELAAGRRVLNVFAYTGGFSLYAARGGAPEVTSVDISAGALAAAARNFGHNDTCAPVAAAHHELLVGDAFAALSQLAKEGRQYDLVVIDPPAFAKRKTEVTGALQAYGRLVRLGLDVLASCGMMVVASCSSRVGADQFFHAVHAAAQAHGRPLSERKRTGHASDHPIGFPEGAYLKCLFATAA